MSDSGEIDEETSEPTIQVSEFYELTDGAIPKLLQGEPDDIPDNVIVQVLTYRAIDEVNDEIIYRVSISDGKDYTTFSITSQALIENYVIEEFSIIQILKHQRVPVSNNEETKNLLILQDFKIVHQATGVIGTPKDFDEIHEIRDAILNVTTVVTYSKSQQELMEFDDLIIEDEEEEEEESSNNIPEKQLIPGRLVKINTLCNEGRNRYWVIKCRVMNKLPVKELFGGKSRMISFILGDSSGNIQACAFDREVEKYEKLFQVGKTYWFADALLREGLTQKQEIKITKYTKVIECVNDDPSLPRHDFKFTPLNQINSVPPGDVADIIGVCTRVSELTEYRDQKHRQIYLIGPESNDKEIDVDVWGQIAIDFNPSTHPVIAIKSCVVSNVESKAKMFLDKNSVFLINPPHVQQVKRLKKWYHVYSKTRTTTTTATSTSTVPNYGDVTVESRYFNHGMARIDTLTNHPTAYLKTIVTVFETDPQYFATLICRDCGRLVHDLNLKQLVCSSCGFVNGAILRNLHTRFRIGDELPSSKWITIADENLRKLLKVTQDSYIKCHDTKYWKAMCDLKGKIFNVEIKVEKLSKEDKKVQLTLIDIDPFMDDSQDTF